MSAMSSSTKKIPSKKLIFKHKPHSECNSGIALHVVATKKSLLHKSAFCTEIDDDIFAQYMKQ